MTTKTFLYDAFYDDRLDTSIYHMKLARGLINSSEEWVSLSDIILNNQVVSGMSISSLKPDLNGIPLVRIGDIDDFGEVDFSSCLKVGAVNNNKFASNYDLSISRMGTLGKTHLINKGIQYYITGHNALLKIKPEYDLRYIVLYMNTKMAKQIINDMATGSVNKGLALNHIFKIPIYYPNKQSRDAIVNKLTIYINQIKKLNNIRRELDELDITQIK